VRTRLTHTLEVTQIARTIARALHLNEDLTEAIGLAHDLGHTPFGHAGEAALASVYPGFRHNEQSLRVVDQLEREGRGINLTQPTRDGILNHSKPPADLEGEVHGRPMTAEGQVVKVSDVIAYLNHDLDDALASGAHLPRPLPESVAIVLGERHSRRIDRLVRSVVEQSAALVAEPVWGRQVIIMGSDELRAAEEFRRYLFRELYEPINALPTTAHARTIVVRLFEYHLTRIECIESGARDRVDRDSPARQAADIVSGMTDDEARYAYDELVEHSKVQGE
jgi:dGTPase